MRRLLLIAIVLVSCNRTKEQHYTKEQQDTIRLASFSRLDEKEAYDFINNYYLQRLDTLETKRKIFAHPMKTPDMLSSYLNKINGIHKPKPLYETINAPPFLGDDTSYTWDQAKLKDVIIVLDKDLDELEKYKSKDKGAMYYDKPYRSKWHQKFGYGYICISYPMYNPYTKRLFINEWVENNDFCGTGRNQKFWFKKIGNKWVSQY